MRFFCHFADLLLDALLHVQMYGGPLHADPGPVYVIKYIISMSDTNRQISSSLDIANDRIRDKSPGLDDFLAWTEFLFNVF